MLKGYLYSDFLYKVRLDSTLITKAQFLTGLNTRKKDLWVEKVTFLGEEIVYH